MPVNIGTRQREFRIRLLLTGVLLALFTAHAAGLVHIRAISHLENLAYDSRLRLGMPFSVDPNIVIVGVDEPSLAQEGRWPWPRDRMGVLVEALFQQYGARAVGLDVVFAEPQDGRRVSYAGQRGHSQWRSIGGWLEIPGETRQERSADEWLADALRGRAVGTAMLFRDGDDGRSVGVLPRPLMRWEQLPKGLEPLESESYTANIPVVAEAAVSGFTDNPLLDSDGHYRRVPLLRNHGGQVYASFALQMAWLVLGDEGRPRIQTNAHLLTQSQHALDIGSIRIPMESDGGILVPFRGPRFSFSYVSAAEVFNGTASKGLFEDRVVLVGAWASRLGQGYATPVAQSMPNIEVQANILSGLLEGRVLQRPSHAVLTEVVTLFLLGFLLTAAFLYLGSWGTVTAAIAALGLFSAANLIVWQAWSLVLPYASVALFIVALFVIHLIYTQIIEAHSRSQLSRVFGQYVPRELVEELSDHPQPVTLAGESRHMTVLFSDIHGFSGIAEALNPRQLAHLMNEFLTAMTRVIHHHRGTIDKYMGDSVMAFWGAPLDMPDHARRAVLAALDMQEEMHRLNNRFAERGWPRLRLGIGINTGHMSVGNMGSEFRMAYTVMGDAVNLASRLEGLTRQCGVGIICSEFTRNAVPEVRFMELGRTDVRGREGPVTIFEPIGLPDLMDDEQEEQAEKFERALDALRAGRSWEVEMIAEALLVADPGRHRLYRWLLEQLDEVEQPEAGDVSPRRRSGESDREGGL
ncbi:CHASE2 domain-containing protein [Natronospira bacteriovora]|uniref:Adenylate/guanylate cyclase domain-containing protein n=1 Tax=Natronospira bacteriovora TaxID=3069753 RepID=A0ABU0W9P1_9GAMM|nr:adenylate/guanylate cyclase domain-containing protein [Natronospira sp. AB-CW4]MDQ2070716.1 adenylate/guanylate cyclase domain-containing protein [Natronospira sp. AB-CW4]